MWATETPQAHTRPRKGTREGERGLEKTNGEKKMWANYLQRQLGVMEEGLGWASAPLALYCSLFGH